MSETGKNTTNEKQSVMISLVNLVKSLTKEDFREMMAFMAVGTAFLYMFLVTFLPIWYRFPEESLRFGDICLGFLFGSVLGPILKYFFDKTPKTDNVIKDAGKED